MRCVSVWGSEFSAGTQRAGIESAAKAFDFETFLHDVDFRRVALGSSDHLDGAGFFRGTTFAPDLEFEDLGCARLQFSRLEPAREEGRGNVVGLAASPVHP
jgi:hypothetical protein